MLASTPGILQELRQHFGPDEVLAPEELGARARNYWDSSPLEALALVRVRSTEDLSRVLRMCHERDQSVVIHGGLTGVCDADRSTAQDVVISLERMTKIEEIDPLGRSVTVQAGCTLQSLQSAVEREGLYFPLDLGARGSCTLGGNVATNAGGINVIRYGMMRAQVLGLEAVLADGTVVSSMNRMLKNNSGYDLKQLFIGTEGTLGVVTRMVLALKERPGNASTVLVALENGDHLGLLLKHMDRQLAGTLTSFEAMWGDYFRAVTEPGWHTSPMDRHHAFYVIVEAQSAGNGDETERLALAVEAAFESKLIVDAVFPKSGVERDRIWGIRENFEALRQHSPLFLYDISITLRDMMAYVDAVKEGLQRQWPASRFYILGHLGDGNLHFFVAPGIADADVSKLHEIADESVYRPLARFGGAVSAEHGIGLEKKTWLPISRSPAELSLMRVLKRALDPKNILNPGKVVEL